MGVFSLSKMPCMVEESDLYASLALISASNFSWNQEKQEIQRCNLCNTKWHIKPGTRLMTTNILECFSGMDTDPCIHTDAIISLQCKVCKFIQYEYGYIT